MEKNTGKREVRENLLHKNIYKKTNETHYLQLSRNTTTCFSTAVTQVCGIHLIQLKYTDRSCGVKSCKQTSRTYQKIPVNGKGAGEKAIL